MDYKYYIYRLQWWFRGFLRYDLPIHIDIELNNNCNQACVSCWHSKPEERKFEIAQMPWEDVERILWYFSKTAKSVKFNLRGEPALAVTLIPAIKLAKQLGYIDVMINTNLTMVPQLLDEILDAGIDTIIVSVDASDVGTYQRLHGSTPDQFYRMRSNIAYLHQLKRFNKLKARVRLNFHKNALNWDDDFAVFKKHYPEFKIVERYTERREGSDISNTPKRRKRKKMCPHMNRRVTHLANGKVYPCCVCYNEPEDIQIGIKGYVSWGKRHELRRIYDIDMPETCRNCTSADIWA